MRFLGAEARVEKWSGELPPSRSSRRPEPDPAPGYAHRDLIVVGASAGGVEALQRLVGGLPAELPAALCVVLHLSPSGRSLLPSILERAGRLPAAAAMDGERPERGHIYVAPQDRHLLLADGVLRVSAGPRENGHRPAIDPMFRSAARGYGPRAIAVVLSGNLDDGSAGARLVKERGGCVLAQDPADAQYSEMPRNAATLAGAHAVLPADAIAERICELVQDPIPPEVLERSLGRDEDAEMEAAMLALDRAPTELTCPACGGSLSEQEEGSIVRFACRVGHVYSADSLVAEHGREVERALWAGLRSLEERADLYRRMARRSSGGGAFKRRFDERSAAADRHAAELRTAISKLDAGHFEGDS